mmetsp:Transcript_7395/g.6660  ORF Transcript_7395/g.6660 Transcript_7395/m.6660 type:complete len:167 (-) Transcript_7395:39-539(-)
MRYGSNKEFRVKGIQIVLQFFQKNGHQVIAFVPDYLLSYDRVIQKKKFNAMSMNEKKMAQIPDNMALMHTLVKQGLIVQTPSQDYDDSYCIQYAKSHSALVVTNDKFRDFIGKQPTAEERKKEGAWVRSCSISYTFHHDQFLPNPDCFLFQEFPYESYLHYPLQEI